MDSVTLFFGQLRIEMWPDWLSKNFSLSYVVYGIFAIVAVIGTIRTSKGLRKGQSDEFMMFAFQKGLSYDRGGESVMPMMPRDPIFDFSTKAFLGIPDHSMHPVLVEFGEQFERFRWNPFSDDDTDRVPYPQAIMRGRDKDGINWTIFQHVQPRSSVSWCLIAESPVLLPLLSMTPENAGTRATKSLGKRELQVENQAFNNRYFIQTDEPDRVLHLLHPQAIDRLMYLIPAEWEFSPRYIMVCLPGTASSQNLDTYSLAIKDFIRMIPGYYRKDFGFTNLP